MISDLSLKIVFVVHYFPPINSSGAKRIEAISKYLADAGHQVTVITTRKSSADGDFTEITPRGVEMIELDWLGRDSSSKGDSGRFEPMYNGKASLKRRVKDVVMEIFGQLPDPRLLFAFAFASPWLARRVRTALSSANVVIGSTPPWPMLLAAMIAKWRFSIPCILDYRDHFSECHEMPGGPFAKWLEKRIDQQLVKHADAVVAISPPMAKYYASMRNDVHCILNGFDHEVLDAARLRSRRIDSNGRIVIRYMGIVSPGRVPHNLMLALLRLKNENPELLARISLEFYGNAVLIAQAISEKYSGLQDSFSYHESVSYGESLRLIVEADFLLFSETSSMSSISAQGILTTKLFEYIGSGRPILADIACDTLAGSVLIKTGCGHIVGNSVEVFLTALRHEKFLERRPDNTCDEVMRFSRRSQALEYEKIIGVIASKGFLK
jgi:hypothetical protein